MTLTSAQVTAFHRDGVLYVHQAVPGHQVDSSRAQIKLITSTGQGARLQMPDRDGLPAEFVLAREVNGALAVIADMLTPAAADLLDEPARAWEIVISPKLPGTGRIEWHQEYRSMRSRGFDRPALVLAWIPVDAAPIQAGALAVVPGSHLLEELAHHRAGGQYAIDPSGWGDLVERECPATPGDVIWFHALTVHGSAPNRTKLPRRAAVISYRAASNEPGR